MAYLMTPEERRQARAEEDAATYRRLRDAHEAVSDGGEVMESERLRLERRAAKRVHLMGEGSGINVAVGDLVIWSASGKILVVDTRLPSLTLTVFDAARHVVPHKVFTTATPDEQRLCQALALHVMDLATFEIHLGHGSSVRVDFDRFREWQHLGAAKIYECPPEVVAWLS